MKKKLAGIFLGAIFIFTLAITIILSLSMIGTIRILKNQITLTSISFEQTYNGEFVSYDNLKVSSGSLKYNDRIVYDDDNIGLTAGIYTLAPLYHIEDKNGNNVTSSYDIVEDFGTLIINKREANLYTGSKFYSSDEKALPYSNGSYMTNIADNDNYSLTNFVTPVKGITNNTCSYNIYNLKYDIDVTSSYYVNNNFGYLCYLDSSTIKGLIDGDYKIDDDQGSHDSKESDKNVDTIKDHDFMAGDDELVYTYIAKIKTKYESNNVLSTNIATSYDVKSGKVTNSKKIDISSYTYNPNTYIYSQLTSSPLKENTAVITYLSKEKRTRDIYIPYTNEFNKHKENKYDSDSIFSSLSEEEISFSFYDYEFSDNPDLLYSSSFNDETMKNEESKYYEEVYKNYMDVPETTKTQLDKFIHNYNLPSFNEANEAEIFSAIKYVFNTYFTYNMKPGWQFTDFVSYFLNISKVGYCTHFATSGMMLLRELGIPSRIVGGYGYKTSGDYISILNNPIGHAWTEMYVKGHGWVKVDFVIDGYSPSSGDLNEEDDNRPVIKISTGGDQKEYDGTPLKVDGYKVSGDLKSGHTIYVENKASIIDSGEMVNSCSYVILNEKGDDVTNEYNIKTNYGTLLVTKKSINASSLSCSINMSLETKNPIIEVNGLDNGMSYKLTTYMDEITSKGEYKEYFLINNIYNDKNEDITHNFIINYNYGIMKVI